MAWMDGSALTPLVDIITGAGLVVPLSLLQQP
jgi:hypothetical protein